MRKTTPKVYLINGPRLRPGPIEEYLRDVGAEEWYRRVFGTALDMGVDLNDAETLVEIAGRLCYRSWVPGLNANVTKIREASGEYLANILSSGHGSVLEHATFTFILHNVSRVFTAEMNRHRAGTAISEQSLRFVRLTDIPFWWPEWTELPEHAELMEEAEALVGRMEEWQIKAADHFMLDDEKVCPRCGGKAMVNKVGEPSTGGVWGEDVLPCGGCGGKGVVPATPFAQKKFYTSFMRRLAPLGLTTEEVWSANIRSIRHVISMRTAEGAEEEIKIVTADLASIMQVELPNLFGDYVEDLDTGVWTTPNWKV